MFFLFLFIFCVSDTGKMIDMLQCRILRSYVLLNISMIAICRCSIPQLERHAILIAAK